MEILFCGSIAGAIAIFFYLFNTARKRAPAAKTGSKQFAPVYISIADTAPNITKGMDKFVADLQRTETAGDKWRWIPLLIFFSGVALIVIDVLLLATGYRSVTFSIGGILLWLAALVLARSLRQSDSYDVAPRYNGTKAILNTLRDDLRPGTTFLGHLDLTGAMLPTKVARSTKDSRSRTTEYFRDEWLALKAKLYDGNILRLSAVQKSKKRQSYYKRSTISGKMKMKPAKFKGTEQSLKVRIVPNLELYTLAHTSPTFKRGLKIGKFTVDDLSTDDGMISFVASSPFEEIDHENILNILQSAYSLLQRKVA